MGVKLPKDLTWKTQCNYWVKSKSIKVPPNTFPLINKKTEAA